MSRTPPAALKSVLLNTPEIELWPAGLLRARSNHDARALARARRVLRRKRDGAYLAADLQEGLLPLLPNLRRESGLGAALDALEAMVDRVRVNPECTGHRLAVLLVLEIGLQRLQQMWLDGQAIQDRA